MKRHDILKYWIEFFGSKEIHFSGEHSDSASKSLKNELPVRYQQLIKLIAGFNGPDKFKVGRQQNENNLISNLSSLLSTISFSNIVNIEDNRRDMAKEIHGEIKFYDFTVNSELPIISEKLDASTIDFDNTSDVILFRNCGYSALLYEFSTVIDRINFEQIFNTTPVIFSLFIDYASFKNVRNMDIDPTVLRKDRELFGKEFESAISAFKKDAAISISAQKSNVDDVFVELGKRIKKINKDIQTSEEIVGGLEDSVEKKIDSVVLTISDKLGLDRANELWDTRYREGRNNFYTGSVLVVSILISFLLFFMFGTKIISSYVVDAVSSMNSFDSANGVQGDVGTSAVKDVVLQTGRIIFLSVPLVAGFWIVRLLVRYTMRSLAIMDDARQRKVMFDTYLYLASQSKVEDSERALVLNALFRPGPGQNSNDIDPPNLSDVLNIGRGKAGNT